MIIHTMVGNNSSSAVLLLYSVVLICLFRSVKLESFLSMDQTVLTDTTIELLLKDLVLLPVEAVQSAMFFTKKKIFGL